MQAELQKENKMLAQVESNKAFNIRVAKDELLTEAQVRHGLTKHDQHDLCLTKKCAGCRQAKQAITETSVKKGQITGLQKCWCAGERKYASRSHTGIRM